MCKWYYCCMFGKSYDLILSMVKNYRIVCILSEFGYRLKLLKGWNIFNYENISVINLFS